MGHLEKSAEVMKLVNNLMKAPEVAITMQQFSKEMTKVPFLSDFLYYRKNGWILSRTFFLGLILLRSELWSQSIIWSFPITSVFGTDGVSNWH